MKRALVSGCSRGIGRAVTLALLKDGWWVLGLSRSAPDFYRDSPWTNDVKDIRFVWESCDLQYENRTLFPLHRFAPLDALVHCAAVRGPVGEPLNVERGAFEDCIGTNLIGTFHALQIALPHLRKSDDGRALLFAGGGAFNPLPGYSAYAASKAGVVSLMETVAAELEQTRVTVNCISPGYVPTSMTEGEDRPSPQMDRAVACVLHMLGPATTGLTGKSISAEYDDWALIGPENVESLNLSNLGTRHRYLIRIGDEQKNGMYRATQAKVLA